MTKCGPSNEARFAVRQEMNGPWSELLACMFVVFEFLSIFVYEYQLGTHGLILMSQRLIGACK